MDRVCMSCTTATTTAATGVEVGHGIAAGVDGCGHGMASAQEGGDRGWTSCARCAAPTCTACRPYTAARLRFVGIDVPAVLCLSCSDAFHAVDDAVLAAVDAVRCAACSSAPTLTPASAGASAPDACAACREVRGVVASLVGAEVLRAVRTGVALQGTGPRKVSGVGVAAAAVLAAPIAAVATVRGLLGGIFGGLVAGGMGGAVAGGALALDARNNIAASLNRGGGSKAGAKASAPAPVVAATATATAAVPTTSEALMVVPEPAAAVASAPASAPAPAHPSTPSGAPTSGPWPPADEELARIVKCKTAYEVLLLPPTATLADIKAAHRARSRAYHPDRNPHPKAHDVSQALNNAYAILGDEDKRRAYDASKYTDTSGIDLFSGIVVTRDGVAASIAGGIFGGLLGAPLGVVAGVFTGLASAATTTAHTTHNLATYTCTAEQAWVEAVQPKLAALERAATGALIKAAGQVGGIMVGVDEAGEVTLAVTLPSTTPTLQAVRWYNAWCRDGVANPSSTAATLAAAMSALCVTTRDGQPTTTTTLDPSTRADGPPPPSRASSVVALVSVLDAEGREGFALDEEAVAAARLEVVGGAGMAEPAWLPAAVAAGRKCSTALRRTAGIVDDEGAGYDDAAVAAARAGLHGLAGVDAKPPTSVMGMARMLGKAMTAQMTDELAVADMVQWKQLLVQHGMWLLRAAPRAWHPTPFTITFHAAAPGGKGVAVGKPWCATGAASLMLADMPVGGDAQVEYALTREQAAQAVGVGTGGAWVAVLSGGVHVTPPGCAGPAGGALAPSGESGVGGGAADGSVVGGGGGIVLAAAPLSIPPGVTTPIAPAPAT